MSRFFIAARSGVSAGSMLATITSKGTMVESAAAGEAVKPPAASSRAERVNPGIALKPLSYLLPFGSAQRLGRCRGRRRKRRRLGRSGRRRGRRAGGGERRDAALHDGVDRVVHRGPARPPRLVAPGGATEASVLAGAT